jgi:hypothetical protein
VNFTGLHELESVGENVTLPDNVTLSSAEISALLGEIPTIRGSTTVSGNAP